MLIQLKEKKNIRLVQRGIFIFYFLKQWSDIIDLKIKKRNFNQQHFIVVFFFFLFV